MPNSRYIPDRIWTQRLRTVAAIGFMVYVISFYALNPSTQKSVFYLFVGLPGLFLLWDIRQHIPSPGKHRSTILALIFLVYTAASCLWSSEGELTGGLKLLLSLLCLMLVVHSYQTTQPCGGIPLPKFIVIIGAGIILISLAMFAMKFQGTPTTLSLFSMRHSLGSLNGLGDRNPINSAIYLGVTALAGWWVFPGATKPFRYLSFGVIVTSVALMLMTQSRGPVGALVLILALLSVQRRSPGDAILCAFAIVASGLAIWQFDLLAIIANRVDAPNYRLEIWTSAVSLIRDHIFFGQGLGTSADIPFIETSGSTVVVSHSHSTFIETFRVGGLIGGGLFVAMLIQLAASRIRNRQRPSFYDYWLVFGLLCLCSNGRHPVIRPSIEWFAFWIPFFLACYLPTPDDPSTGSRRKIYL